MNRRGFFGAIAAVTGAMALPTGYVSWFQWKPRRYLYVVPTQRQAEALYNELGRPRNVKVISTGGMVCGYGADLIVMDEKWREAPHSEHERSIVRKAWLDNWFNSTIRTRLYRDGRIITRSLT